MNRVKIIGVNISAVNMETALSYLKDNYETAKGNYICAANVHTTVTAFENLEYREIQNHSFLTLPDGKPLSVIGKKRGFNDMDRVTGPEFMEEIIKATEKTECSHYFYGTTQENLDELARFLNEKYPQLKIAGIEPSVFRQLSTIEEEELIERINSSNADFVWVALGAPKQEIFCSKLCASTKAVWIAVGGAFNVLSGTIPRAPKWMQDHSLEWLFRLSKEPKRLFKRYFVTNTKFIWYLLREKEGN